MEANPPPETAPKDGEISIEERSLWMCRALEEDSEALEFRERTYPWTKTHSFGVLKRANFTSCRAQLDRHRVLELVYQHLHSIGMHHAAFTLAKETQLEFQRKDQKMERTDLRLLISMSLGPRDNLWDDSGIDGTVLAEEPFDDDNGSVRYAEPYRKIVGALADNNNIGETSQYLIQFSSTDKTYNFSDITYAPLCNLIAAIVVSEGPIKVTKDDREKFYLTLNSICRSEHFFGHLHFLYDQQEATNEIKTKILFVIDEWVHFSGLFIGKNTLSQIINFLQSLPGVKEAQDLLASIPTLQYGNPIYAEINIPPPVIDDPVSLLHPDLTLAEPEAIEVARQISLVVHNLFAAIHPREFYIAISQRSLSLETCGINELFEFGKKLKLLIASTILAERKSSDQCRRKFEMMINIASKLLDINNFEALSWFVSAFDMKCIKNLSKLCSQLPEESRNVLKELRENYDWRRYNSGYDLKLQQCYQNKLAAVPNMRYELANVAVGGYGTDEFSQTNNLVNWGKRNKAAAYIQRYKQFQNTKYNYHRIAQIQNVLSDGIRFTKEKLNAFSIDIESPIKDYVAE